MCWDWAAGVSTQRLFLFLPVWPQCPSPALLMWLVPLLLSPLGRALLRPCGSPGGLSSVAMAVGLRFFCLWLCFWAWDTRLGSQQFCGSSPGEMVFVWLLVFCVLFWFCFVLIFVVGWLVWIFCFVLVGVVGFVCLGFFQHWPFSHVWVQSPWTQCTMSTCSKVHKACTEPGIYLYVTFCCTKDLVFSWLRTVPPFYHGCMNKAFILQLKTVGYLWQEGMLVLKPVSATPIFLFLF